MTGCWTLRAGVALLALVAMAVLSGCGGAQSRYANHLERGKQYFADGKLDKASVEFRNALQIQPKSAEALFLNAETAERRGDLRAAFGNYQAAIDLNPDYVEAEASLARLYALVGATDKATAIVTPALAKHPNDAELLTVRAAVRARQKDLPGARADAQRAVQIAPTNEGAIALLAGFYHQDGDLDHAISLLADSVARLPSAADLREVLAGLYGEAHKSKEAEEQLLKIVELRPQELSRRYRLALFYTSEHRLDDAQRVLADAVKSQPDSNEAKIALVELVATQRSREQGEKILRDFIARDPGNYDLRLSLGGLLAGAGAREDALKAYQEIADRDGTGAKGLIARSRIAELDAQLGRYEPAMKLIGEVLEHNPHDTDALALRGQIELQRGDAAAAISDLRAVLRDQPKAIPIQRGLARAYRASDQPAMAEETLRSAIDTSPDDSGLRVELAQLLVQTNRSEQAVPLLEEVVRRAPNDLAGREALVRAYIAKGDLASARTAAEDLKILRPNAAAGFYLAGLVAQSQQRLEDSKKELEHALDLQPNALDALSALVHLQIAAGRPAEVIPRLEHVVQNDPKNAAALDLLGELYVSNHDVPRGVQTLSRATEVAPQWWYAYRDLAIAYLTAKDPERAIAAYKAGIKAAPGATQLVFELASFYEKQGRVDDAIALYTDLNRHDPKSTAVANNLAMLLVTYKTDKASLDRARDLTMPLLSSDNGALLDTGGWVRLKRGEFADALRILQRAADRAPDSKVIRYHLAMAELQQGDRNHARTDLETALAGSPRFAGSDEARAVLAGLN